MSWWAIAAQAVGSVLSRRSSRQQSQSDTRAEREFLDRQNRQDAANRRAELEAARRWNLEDRRYREETIGGYRGYSRGDYGSPAYTDTNPSRIEVPVIEDPKEQGKPRKKAGLLGG